MNSEIQTRVKGLTIDVERLRVSLVPEVCRDGTNTEGSTVVRLNDGERETNNHEVGVVVPVLGPFSYAQVSKKLSRLRLLVTYLCSRTL